MAGSVVTIEDSTIFTMLNDPKMAAEIPCLIGKRDIFRNTNTGCGACAKKKQARRREELARIKTCLAALSTEKKNLLKQWLNAAQIRVVYISAGGKVTQMTF